MSTNEIENLKKYFRAANYLSVIQIFLQNNYLLERPLVSDDVKSRLLGHWGTCPGINFVYANLNHLIKKHGVNMMYVVGPGHGYPAVQANLFLEKTLGEYYPEATHNKEGIEYITKNFSWPYGFPSHSSPHTPGVILEGGELGYSLSTSYGAVLDNPDLIVTCLVGDGEAETGPIATAWHCNKFIDPKTNGAVLPILHLNGYKISGPTILARMSDEEITNLFKGYGYEPVIVDHDKSKDIFNEMAKVMENSYLKIKKIQDQARGKGLSKHPVFPMIILRTPKGWTGIKEIDGKKITGNHYSHQVPLKNARIDNKELKLLEGWLRTYNFEELFDGDEFIKEINDVVPEGDLRMGKNKHAFGGPEVYETLGLPRAEKFEEKIGQPGSGNASSMKKIGEFVNETFSNNPDNFRLFSPDETYSNKLDKVFDTTSRAFVWPLEKWDDDISTSGRVIEMLSEHTLQGMMQGYVLTGRHGIFASYEAFIQIIASMADQYAKFLKQAKEVSWRGNIPSFNYILTSSSWRQDHNGFSHQNPGFIDDMLQRQGDFINVYFPADGNSALAVIERVLESSYGINLIVAGKQDEPQWISIDQAKEQLDEGLGIWKFASDDNPDIVFSSIGDYLTKESLAAISLLKKDLPDLKIRFVNVTTLSESGFGSGGNVLSKNDFGRYFTEEKPVLISYHAYPQTIKQILFDYTNNPERFRIKGYIENGSTTTPFDMQMRNGTSRYHLIIDACEMLERDGFLDKEKTDSIVKKYQQKISESVEYAKKHGVDSDEITQWQWGK